MTTVNPLWGIVELLRADTAITGITRHIYAGELPRSLQDVQPVLAVIIARSGGATPANFVRQSVARIDTHCFGPSMGAAATLDSAVHYALRNVNDNWTESVRFLDVLPTAGPIDGRDNVREWPRVFRSYDVLYQEER